MYRFAGVKERSATMVQTDQCCEPICGPTTCGISPVDNPKTESEGVKVKTINQCCEPLCGPETCG